MREWPGVRDDQTQVGTDGLSEVIGVSFGIDGEIRRRSGLTIAFDSGGGIAMGAFRQIVTGSWLVYERDSAAIFALNLDTADLTGLGGDGLAGGDFPAYIAPLGPRIYLSDDYLAMQVWDGIGARSAAGMAAPTTAMGNPSSTGAGSTTAGVHLIRYRYLDSKSPNSSYVSNPSDANEYTVAVGGKTLNFTIGATGSGSPVIRSDDTKCDTIQIEMTAAAGNVYYVATTVLNAATTVAVSIDDDTLIVQTDVAVDFGDFGHEQPPAGNCFFDCRGFSFLCGTTRQTKTVAVTNASVTVTGDGTISPLWAGRLIRFASQTKAYEISAVSSNGVTITLTEAYTGSTAASISGVIYAKDPNLAYWSDQYRPESWKALERARTVLAGFGDRVIGGCDFQGDAWFFGQRSMGRLVFADDPANGEVNPVPGYHGLWSAKCLVPLDGVLYGWGPNGVWQITGGAPRWISKPIDTTVAALLDRTASAKFHGAYDPIEKVIRWWFVADGDDVPKVAMTYDMTGQRWSLDEYRQGIDASCTVADTNGRIRLAVSDETNVMTYYHDGATDGVNSSSSGVYTVTVGSAGDTLVVVEPLPTGTNSYIYSLILYRPSTGEEKVIYDNNTTTITMESAFLTSPVVGEQVYVGAIPCSVKTSWWVNRDLSEKKRPHLHLLFTPDATATVLVKVYRDFSDTAIVWTRNVDDVFPDGVTVVNGRSYITVACAGSANITDGFVSLPMPTDFGRAWRAEVICLSPAGTLKVLDVRFGAAGVDTNTETDE